MSDFAQQSTFTQEQKKTLKILITSYAFAPAIGGIEHVSLLLKQGFQSAGHEVRVLTETPLLDSQDEDCVFRKPSIGNIIRQLVWCDVHLQSNISLRYLLLALALRRATMIVFHTWVRRPNGHISILDKFKLIIARHADRSVAVSNALARSIGPNCGHICNPYDAELFQPRRQEGNLQSFLFVGRLVNDKGVDLLIRAFNEVFNIHPNAKLTVIGDGPEMADCRKLAHSLGCRQNIEFKGPQSSLVVAEAMQNHLSVVIPSRWDEPFGLVALQSNACGAITIASDTGGLREAAGTHSFFFPRESLAHLVEIMLDTLALPIAQRASIRADGYAHVDSYRSTAVVEQYLSELKMISASH